MADWKHMAIMLAPGSVFLAWTFAAAGDSGASLNTCTDANGQLIITDRPCRAAAPAAVPVAVREIAKTESAERRNLPVPKRRSGEVRDGDAALPVPSSAVPPHPGSAAKLDLAERCARYRLESEVQDALARVGGSSRAVKEHKAKKKQAEARIRAECG
ncbi:MAG: hypothetical protein HYU77_13380 [Betaproteobacteria bacterium]|nr:hypothetical protein [Betaproteobacteria bacterium]